MESFFLSSLWEADKSVSFSAFLNVCGFSEVKISKGACGKTVLYHKKYGFELLFFELLLLIKDTIYNTKYTPKLTKYINNTISDIRYDKPKVYGISCMIDKLIQQCILQVIEPICEAKFSNNSYGYRPFKTYTHTIAAVEQHLNLTHLYNVIKLDLNNFYRSFESWLQTSSYYNMWPEWRLWILENKYFSLTSIMSGLEGILTFSVIVT